MAKQYGWIAKDKDGDFWFGTLGKTKEDVESHFVDSTAPISAKRTYGIEIVQIELVEMKYDSF